MAKNKSNTPIVKPAIGVNKEEVTPVVAETPAATETPVVTETPAVVETNAVTETPVVAETPAVTETPVVAETPAATETPVVTETPAVVETPAVTETHDATLIPSGRFIAKNGNEYEFAVNSFTFQGKTYTKEEALSDHNDVLEHLASVKSFILKKV